MFRDTECLSFQAIFKIYVIFLSFIIYLDILTTLTIENTNILFSGKYVNPNTDFLSGNVNASFFTQEPKKYKNIKNFLFPMFFKV